MINIPFKLGKNGKLKKFFNIGEGDLIPAATHERSTLILA